MKHISLEEITSQIIKQRLEALTGDNRLDAISLKNLPTNNGSGSSNDEFNSLMEGWKDSLLSGEPTDNSGILILDSGEIKVISKSSLKSWIADTPPVVVQPTTGVFGMASLAGGTTGGTGGTTLTSSDPTAIASFLNSTAPKILYISGTIDRTAVTGSYFTIKSNTTIIGLPGSKLINVGLKITDASNIIIRNITSERVRADEVDNDNISIRNSHHIWIDHCDLSGSPDYRTLDETLYDGLIDMTNAADFITISNSFLHDTWKCMLVGNDQNKAPNVGKLNITLAYNKFQRCHERTPLAMNAKIHMFNNYFKNSGVGTNSGIGIASIHESIIRTDNNVFENVWNPIVTSYNGEQAGFVVNAESNIITGDPAQVMSITTTPPTWDVSQLYSYSSMLKPAEEASTYVSANVGAILTEF